MGVRKPAGLTQRDLAARLGKPPSFVAKIETGERRLDFVEFVAIARELGTTPGSLIDQIDAEIRRNAIYLSNLENGWCRWLARRRQADRIGKTGDRPCHIAMHIYGFCCSFRQLGWRFGRVISASLAAFPGSSMHTE